MFRKLFAQQSRERNSRIILFSPSVLRGENRPCSGCMQKEPTNRGQYPINALQAAVRSVNGKNGPTADFDRSMPYFSFSFAEKSENGTL